MPTVLLIERPQKTSYADALKKRYDVISLTSGKIAVERAPLMQNGVIVLDAISLRTTGERIARQIKAEIAEMPLIHLHNGLKDGVTTPADAVLIPPFTARKLVNAIERLVRIAPEPAIEETLINCGPLSMNVTRRLLHVNGQEISLSPKMALLVEYFLRHPGETVDRKTLMEQVWETDYLGDTRTLDVHIRWLRRAIEATPDKPIYLKTVRKVGYRLDLTPALILPVHAADTTLQPA